VAVSAESADAVSAETDAPEIGSLTTIPKEYLSEDEKAELESADIPDEEEEIEEAEIQTADQSFATAEATHTDPAGGSYAHQEPGADKTPEIKSEVQEGISDDIVEAQTGESSEATAN
jgi:hypothetical protein